ncbi:hypothetical protein B0J12DRAFT_666536 [Macrophomina phaseolina]|uniref:Hydrophobin n=1 Tax=Macrophomina phaseolina TaxID=35725 RepID=A0ABQ8G7H4_9PEZI|nr:hypothetical protein B0J12DRAFT_666536 [Macrophomina phaseolina]
MLFICKLAPLMALPLVVLAAPANDPTLRTRTATEIWLSRRQTQCSSAQSFGCCHTGEQSCAIVGPTRSGNESLDALEEPCSPISKVSCCNVQNVQQHGIININTNMFNCNPLIIK